MNAKRISKKRLAEIWCELNCHKRPKEFSRSPFKQEDVWGAMKLINIIVGDAALKRAWKKYEGIK